MNFLDLGLSENICSVLLELGYETPTEIQQKAIPELLSGRDILARSETGSGKTFAFGLPIIQMASKSVQTIEALVVCPTRELCVQVADEIKKVASKVNIRTCAVFGGSNIDRQIDALKRNPNIVVGTPGRIIDLLKRNKIKLENIKTLVLDEADEMLDMGFRPDIEKIIEHTNSDRQTVLFSATIPQEIKDIVDKYQKNSITIEIGTENKALDKITQSYLFVDQKHKQEVVKELFMTDVFGKTILFVNTKRYAEELESSLNKSGIESKAIHGDLRQSERKRVLQGFKDGKFDILIATDVAARGLDIKEIKYVVNYDLPQILEYYVHRIGRTARAGESGEVIDIITNLSQLSYLKDIEKATNAKIEKYQTRNEFIISHITDTKKLAEKSRFGKKVASEKKSVRFGGQSEKMFYDSLAKDEMENHKNSKTKRARKSKEQNSNNAKKMRSNSRSSRRNFDDFGEEVLRKSGRKNKTYDSKRKGRSRNNSYSSKNDFFADEEVNLNQNSDFAGRNYQNKRNDFSKKSSSKRNGFTEKGSSKRNRFYENGNSERNSLAKKGKDKRNNFAEKSSGKNGGVVSGGANRTQRLSAGRNEKDFGKSKKREPKNGGKKDSVQTKSKSKVKKSNAGLKNKKSQNNSNNVWFSKFKK
jgi:superfamily II DNA/RNA helicase